jgi:glycosyltransferase involved in cell wall biosynthesis
VVHLTNNPSQTLAASKKQILGNPLLDHWNRVLTTGINAPLEPERVFWSCRKLMEDSVLIGFGGDQPGYLATLWAKWLGLKSMVLFRGNDFERVIHDAKRAWITHFVLQNADVVGAVSQEMVARISALRNERTIYTPNSIDSTEWTFFESDLNKAATWRAQNIPDGKPVIGVIGQLKSKKGLDLALTLVASAEYREKAHLLTVGDIPAQIKEESEFSASDNWTHVPFRRRERLPVFYAVADVVFIPSIYDGMPNVLLEAMSLGKTVVASRAGGIPDVITDGENGLLFDIGDAPGVMKALDTALSMTQEQRSRIGSNARKTIEEHFTPEEEIKHIEAGLLIE